MPRSVLRIGTRGSPLALAQAESVRRAVGEVLSHRTFELVPIVTAGDRRRGVTPGVSGGKSLYTEEIQTRLAGGEIDLAVHSAKDLPVETPDGVAFAAVPPREDPRDALVTRHGLGLVTLQPGTTVGTASLRRAAQVLALGRGLVPTPIRGNVDTRLRKLTDGAVGALVVAVAGLRRLRRTERIAEILNVDLMLPAPGQGALAVECRSSDRDMAAALAQVEDPDARRAVDAERAFLAALGGSCRLPLAALAILVGERVRIRGLVATLDGRTILRDQLESEDPEKAGVALAERLREGGAAEIIAAAEKAEA